ncbi:MULTISPECIES: HD-GYP domain-containing protein [Vibrio]|uniref:HD domain-containing protein n=1 Tax=Vibrio tasmaniensis TaxID=212663 RepID=A0A2N7NNV6_9VIBR|nr:HD domain-containing phosphohydrolase [Vibrio tasmaniensis]PMP18594.1 metal-dependent phosphohydrolase [Vibrio tasmaniensis]TKG30626.1 HD domain-containing protein [Vibrio tasmaniensis]TKG39907.1 HD domain-containing protein [Vibrio tasmaniensis]TKG49619.1 HD domain-containing protein [Vibrio tasmaniensis]TKG52758.1 HD domain-containing protein [Vibrio tasmaniensis]
MALTMFDYSQISRVAAQDKDIIAIVDDLFRLAREHYPILSRLSVVLCNENRASNYFVSDTLCQEAEHRYIEQELKPESALSRMAESLDTRIIHDLTTISPTKQISHLLDIGHQSSYTTPIHHQESNLGFVFINASSTGFFANQTIQCDIAYLTQVISSLFIQWFERQRHFQSSLAIALNMGHARDPETKEHLIRMGKYSEHIARTLSHSKEEITHQFIHRIRLYAPFHDIGKYRIPDKVLFSSARFNEEERAVMDNHTLYGEEMINNVVALSCHSAMCSEEIQFIKNIVRHHHERFDGTGLPDALSNTAIPLEARIVTLADVFDALMSKRAYKHAWTLDEVMDYIEAHSGSMFDPECVVALKQNLDGFMAIREQYNDDVQPHVMTA